MATRKTKQANTMEKLTTLLKKTLPMIMDTGKAKHLQSVHPDPASHGQGVTFTWNKTQCRMVQRFGNLTCNQRDFKGRWIDGPVSSEVMTILKSKKSKGKTADRSLVMPACPLVVKI